MNCRQQTSVKDSFDFELQSRLHLDVITLLLNKGEVWLFSVGTYHLDVPAFLLPKSRLTTEWPAEWDMILRIEVHNNDKSSGHCYVKVDIYFTAAGMIDIPTEQEILAMMEEIRENPQDFRFVA